MDAPTRYPYLHIDVPEADREEASELLWSLGAQGIEERDAGTLQPSRSGEMLTLLVSFADDEAATDAATRLGDRWPARLEHVEGDAWRHAWKRFFKPSRIGRHLVVKPSWETYDARPDDLVLTVDPGMAFGTGTHATTRLVLAELEARVAGGETVLDVGCGSGILAIAALKLGAAEAVAIDIDPDSVTASRENAELNRIVAPLDVSTTPVERVEGRYDIVIANIQANVLQALAEPLIQRVAPGGLLLLSGVLAGQAEAVRSAFAELQHLATPVEGEWVAIVLRSDEKSHASS